ncbi:MAG: 16S rRNA processing protein RimM [Spirochaetales bacterium]|nr:16S rRNA processing protein RimM [Spirochaetales bacterium]
MDELALGRLGAPHGLDGRIKLVPFSGETEHLHDLAAVSLRGNGRTVQARVASVREAGASVLVKFDGYDSPEAVRALVGLELWAPRGNAAPLDDGQYYYADLVGCMLVDGDREVATVVAVCDSGGGDLLEIAGSDGKSAYVPFRKEFVGRVDVAAKRIELIAPWILD